MSLFYYSKYLHKLIYIFFFGKYILFTPYTMFPSFIEHCGNIFLCGIAVKSVGCIGADSKIHAHSRSYISHIVFHIFTGTVRKEDKRNEILINISPMQIHYKISCRVEIFFYVKSNPLCTCTFFITWKFPV